MKAEGGGQVLRGTRVDCLFGDEYFRGRVDDTGGGGSSYRVIFDDGDIREGTPPEDVELPLEQGCRVECMFEVDVEWSACLRLEHLLRCLG